MKEETRNSFDVIADLQAKNKELQNKIDDLKGQLLIAKSDKEYADYLRERNKELETALATIQNVITLSRK